MDQLSRRKFIQQSALASTALMLPKFLYGLDRSPIINPANSGKILVIVQLTGGNDALNTVIPFRNDDYYRARPKINIPSTEALKLSDEIALHPALSGLQKLFDDGNLGVINGVGYPDPDRSHFRSMDIWQSASASNEYIYTGWIGRYLDANCPQCSSPYTAIEVDDTLSLALKGKEVNGLAVKNPQRLHRNISEGYYGEIAKEFNPQNHHHEQASYLYKTLTETINAADYIYQQSKIYKSAAAYPTSVFSQNLKTIAELIISGSATRVYYVSLSGFDTHVQQVVRHAEVLKDLNDGLAVFINDLKKNNRFDDVLVMSFSEFGRRVEQNASGGTDHGKAGNIFVIGNKLKKAGIYNPVPSLTDLDSGDLKYNIDFRQVYTTLIDKWLHTDPRKIMNKDFEGLDFI